MKIEGKVETIIFKNNQNSWSVLLIKSQKEYITAVGQTDEIEVGDDIELEGEMVKHKVYGEQLKFTTYKKILPRTSSALIDYIADNIKGIGKKTASKIVTEFGKSTIDTIRFQKEKLSNIKGLNREKINNLSEFFNNEYDKWNTIDYLNKLGISIIIASKIYKSLGQETINIINENPYSLIGYVKSLDFTNIDDIGKKLGVSLYNEERIDSGIIYALGKVTEFGHTCIEIDILVKYAIKILEVEEDIIRNGITRLMLNDIIKIDVIEDVEYVFKKNFYLAEKNIAKNVVLRSKIINNKDYIKDIDKTSRKNNIELSEEQKKAINTCLNNSISIITGGPGTGKTTIIKFIIDILEEQNKDYILSAPTGRAAKRITQTTNKEAKTLHRLLEISKTDDLDIDFSINSEVKEIDADIVIIDEASMIDTIMMNNVFKALKPNASLILVGDVNQLPSVGPGNILKDIIDSSIVNTVYLKQIYRQSAKSDIIINAHKVNNGEYPEFKTNNTDLYYITTDSIESTLSEIASLVSHRLENFKNINILKDLQILTPMRKTELGTMHLNAFIQNILNPKSYDKKEKQVGERMFRVGDKVMQVINNYDKKYAKDGQTIDGIYNGDIGYITDINTENEKFEIQYDDKVIEYDFEEFDQIELAYSITVHKSQGSEFDYIILPLYTGYKKLFTRNLLYTAITRAKKMLIIIGNKKIINFMVDNINAKERKTGLKNKILEIYNFTESK